MNSIGSKCEQHQHQVIRSSWSSAGIWQVPLFPSVLGTMFNLHVCLSLVLRFQLLKSDLTCLNSELNIVYVRSADS